jgi:cysteine desulfurase
MTLINLDHNSTTPVFPEVIEALAAGHRQSYANPASQHQSGRRARQVLEDTREEVGRQVGADLTSRPADKLIFTSGGTEANNLAIFGLAFADSELPGEAITSAIEHPSVRGPMERLERSGWLIHRVGVTRDGVVKVDEFARYLNARTRFASVMLANNETGVLQPIAELAALAQRAGVPLHTDAVQMVGKLPVDIRQLGAAALTLSGHKFHGPPGVGALVLRHGARIAPLAYGGFQQWGLRPGSEPVALAVGLLRALEIYEGEAVVRARRMRELRNRLEAGLKAGFPGVAVNGAGASRLPHTSSLAFVGLDRQALAMALDLAGVACSTGSACASGSSEPSGVLLAMDCPREVVSSSLRFSLGAETTAEEIDEAVRRIVATTGRLAGSTRKVRVRATV